ITPDTQYIYSATAHQEALNTVLLALQSGEGFVKISGEVGTGKTLLCRRLLRTFGEDTITAYLPNPQLDPRTLLLTVAEELGVADGPGEAFHVIKRINHRLIALAGEGKTAILCIDEAQTMPPLTLETLRLLSNLETEKRKLIHIILFGQPELDEMLNRPSARQLRQRIAFNYKMPPLSRDEMERYLDHRLQVAGYRGPPLFSPMACRALYGSTKGTPRLVNLLAHKSLLAAFGQGQYRIAPSHVRQAAIDTDGAGRVPWWIPGW
ncbi:MAG TPA: AAA family ATPase, partial [Rhodocyclaceae bacterium]